MAGFVNNVKTHANDGRKSKRLFITLCSIELVIAIIGFSAVLWIKTTNINDNIKDFLLGLIGAIYFFLAGIIGILGSVCESSCLLLSHAACGILSTLISSAVTCLYLLDDTNLIGFKRAAQPWQNGVIIAFCILLTVCFCGSIIVSYWVRHNIMRAAVIKSRTTSPKILVPQRFQQDIFQSGTQQNRNFSRSISSFQDRVQLSRNQIPKRNHLDTNSVISFRPPSTAGRGLYSRLEEERSASRLSAVPRGPNDDTYSTLDRDRSASRMSRRSIGPPRPPPPKSRPDSRIDTSDLSQLRFETKIEPKIRDEPKIQETEFSRSNPPPVISEFPDDEIMAAMEEEKRILLLDHARKILENDMKRRQQTKLNGGSVRNSYRDSIRSDLVVTDDALPKELLNPKSTNPFGTPRIGGTPRLDHPKSELIRDDQPSTSKKDQTNEESTDRKEKEIFKPKEVVYIPPPPFMRKHSANQNNDKAIEPTQPEQSNISMLSDGEDNSVELPNVDSHSSGLHNRLYISAQPSIDTLDEILYKADHEKC